GYDDRRSIKCIRNVLLLPWAEGIRVYPACLLRTASPSDYDLAWQRCPDRRGNGGRGDGPAVRRRCSVCMARTGRRQEDACGCAGGHAWVSTVSSIAPSTAGKGTSTSH